MTTFEQKPDFQQNIALSEVKSKVRELCTPTEEILEKLSPLLESGEVQLLIGDDASGRVPTAIIRKIFDMAYSERGFVTPETRFLAGSRDLYKGEQNDKKKAISDYLDQVKIDVENKFGRPLTMVLVVTDVINSGQSLDPLIEALNEKGIQVKVISMGVITSEAGVHNIEERWHAPILSGMFGMPYIYGEQKISGMIKDSDALFARPFKNEYTGNNRAEKMKIQEQINKSREVSDEVAIVSYEKWNQTHGTKK